MDDELNLITVFNFYHPTLENFKVYHFSQLFEQIKYYDLGSFIRWMNELHLMSVEVRGRYLQEDLYGSIKEFLNRLLDSYLDYREKTILINIENISKFIRSDYRRSKSITYNDFNVMIDYIIYNLNSKHKTKEDILNQGIKIEELINLLCVEFNSKDYLYIPVGNNKKLQQVDCILLEITTLKKLVENLLCNFKHNFKNYYLKKLIEDINLN